HDDGRFEGHEPSRTGEGSSAGRTTSVGSDPPPSAACAPAGGGTGAIDGAGGACSPAVTDGSPSCGAGGTGVVAAAVAAWAAPAPAISPTARGPVTGTPQLGQKRASLPWSAPQRTHAAIPGSWSSWIGRGSASSASSAR